MSLNNNLQHQKLPNIGFRRIGRKMKGRWDEDNYSTLLRVEVDWGQGTVIAGTVENRKLSCFM
ncbi:hypothetical protein J6590_021349 [Homalodisca vitripennis]|nr:hypothetical protein J6590_021349 [Homalodisca vitripennis]